MTDWIVKLYRKMNTTARRAAVLLLAFVIAMSTLHFMTFPATALTRKAGENDPGIVIGDETNTEGFDNASEGENTEVNPVNTETAPTEEPAVITGGETPAPADTTVNAEPTPDGNEEAAVIVEPTATPEVTPTPEPTETPAAEEESEEVSDSEADVETAEDWEDMFRDVELTGVWADDLLTLAELQKGYKESTKNFVKDDEGKKYGYTRYGEWYGDPYAEWDSLFVMFNLYYAGITKLDFPYQADCEEWIDALKEAEMFHEVNTYVPNKGDLVFADVDEDGESDHVAIVKAVEKDEAGNPDKLIVIEGDIDNEVKESTYEFYNPLITGFAQLPENPEMVEETEAVEEAIAEEPAETEEPVVEVTAEPETEETVEIEERTFTATANRVEVTVVYPSDAFPEGTTMTVTPIWDKGVVDTIKETVSEENKEILSVQAVDITFYDAEGNKIEPSKPIKVTMKSNAVPTIAAEKPVVVHVDNEMSASVVDAETPEEANDQTEAVQFESDAFSVYAIVYTVDFEYGDYAFSIYGGSTISVAEVLVKIGVFDDVDTARENIADVKFSDESLVKVIHRSKMLGFIGNEDWLLESVAPFWSEETLAITLTDGRVIKVVVKDLQYTTSLNDVLTDLTINGAEWDPSTQSYTVKPGKSYSVDLTFQEGEGNDQYQFSNDGWMYLTLPDGVTFNTNGTFDIFVNEAGENYTISGNQVDTDGRTIKVKLNKTDPNYQKLKDLTTAKFMLKVSGEFNSDSSEYVIDGQTDTKIKVDNTPDVNITKTGTVTEWNKDNNTAKVTYRLEVRSNGTTKDVRITDTIQGTGLTLDQDSVKVTVDGSTVSNWTTNSKSSSGFVMTTGELKDGKTYVIEYTATLDKSQLKNNGDGTYSIDGSNTVNWLDDKTTTHNLDHVVKKPGINKSATASTQSGSVTTTTWTVEADSDYGENNQLKTFTDRLGSEGMQYKSDSNIHVVVKDKDNDNVVTEQDIRMADVLATDGKSWSYDMSQITPNAGKKYHYTITYQTTYDIGSATTGQNIKNNWEDNRGNEGSEQSWVNPNPENRYDLDKQFISKEKNEANETIVTWTIKVTVPAAGLTAADAVLTDMLPKTGEYQDTFVELVSTSGLFGGESVEVDSASATDKVTFTFKKNGTDAGLNPSAGSAREITLTLKTKCDARWLADNDAELTHTNEAIFHNIHKNASYTPDKPSIKKEGWRDGEAGGLPKFSYSITAGVFSNELFTNPCPYPNTTVGNDGDGKGDYVVIEDTFDNRLTYVEGSATVGGGDQWSQEIGRSQNGVVAEVDETNHKIRFKLYQNSLPKNNGNLYQYYKINYSLKVKDRKTLEALRDEAIAQGKAVELANSVHGFGDQTIKVNYEPKILDKYHTEQDGKLLFTIKVNEEGLKLSDNGVLILTDTMENLSVRYQDISVSVAGNKTVETTDSEGNPVTAPYFNMKGDVITFYIPDEAAVEITYRATARGDVGADGKIHYSNTAKVKGFEKKDSGSEDYKNEGSGYGTNYGVYIYKADGLVNSNALAGSVFKLYEVDEVDAEGNIISGTPVKGPDGKTDFTVTTSDGKDGGQKGVVAVIGNEELGWNLKPEKRYYLLEVKAPEGYALDNTKYSFIISKDGYVNYTRYPVVAPDGSGKLVQPWTYHNGDVMTVKNWRKDGVLTLEKGFENIDPAQMDDDQKSAIKFDVYTVNEDGTEKLWRTITYDQFTLTTKEDGTSGYTYTIGDLPEGKYRVVETINDVTCIDTTYAVVDPDDGSGANNHSENKDERYATIVISAEDVRDHTENKVEVTNTYELPSEFKIYKHAEGETSYKLAKAKFGVFAVGEGGSPVGEAIATYTTNSRGRFSVFQTDADGQSALAVGTVYALKETEAPVGFLLNKDVIYFCFLAEGDSALPEGAPNGTVAIPWKSSVEQSITDTPNTTYLEATKVYLNDMLEVDETKSNPVTVRVRQIAAYDKAGTVIEPELSGYYKIGSAKPTTVAKASTFQIVKDGTTGKWHLSGDGVIDGKLTGLTTLIFDNHIPIYYNYEVEEVIDPNSEYVAFYESEKNEDGGTKATVTNRPNTTVATTRVHAKKKWINAEGEDVTSKMGLDDAVKVDVYRYPGLIISGKILDGSTVREPSDQFPMSFTCGTQKEMMTFLPGDRFRITLTYDKLSDFNSGTLPNLRTNHGNDATRVKDEANRAFVFEMDAASDDGHKDVWFENIPSSGITMKVENLTADSNQRVQILTQAEASLLSDSSKLLETLSLGPTNGWSAESREYVASMKVQGQYSQIDVPLSYFVVEPDGSNFEADYTFSQGEIVITNVEKRVEVKKKWLAANDDEITAAKEDGSVSFELYQSAYNAPLETFDVNFSQLKMGHTGWAADAIAKVSSSQMDGTLNGIKKGSNVEVVVKCVDESKTWNNTSLDGMEVTGATSITKGSVVTSPDNTVKTLTYTLQNVFDTIRLNGCIVVAVNNYQCDYDLSIKVKVLYEPDEDTTTPLGEKVDVGTIVVSYDNAVFTPTDSFSEKGITTKAGTDAWSAILNKLPAAGNDERYNGKQVTYGYSLVETESEGFDLISITESAAAGGTLVAVNKLKAGSLKVTKVVAGANPEKTYEIAVMDADGNYYKADGTNNGTTPWYESFSANDEITWNPLTPGNYTITEKNASEEGYTWTVSGADTVKVVQDQTVNQTVTNNYFKNTEYTPKITKSLKVGEEEVTPWPEGASFDFYLSFNSEDSTGVSKTDIVMANREAIATEGKKTGEFGKIEFKKPGTYVFTIEEVEPAGTKDHKRNGIIYSTDNTVTLTVVVGEKDGKPGELEVKSKTYSPANGEQEEGLITNTLDYPAYAPSVTKKLTKDGAEVDETIWNGKSFTFDLELAGAVSPAKTEDVIMPTAETDVQKTVTASSAGHKETFGAIAFKAAGTYNFTVTEQYGGDVSVTYDKTPKNIAVTVTADEDGNLAVTKVTVGETDVTGEAIVGSGVTVENKIEEKNFEFSKIWKNTSGESVDWPEGKSITVTLNAYTSKSQKALDDETLTFSIGKLPEGWTKEVSSDGKKVTFKKTGLRARTSDGDELTYYVVEQSIDGYKDPIYKAADGTDVEEERAENTQQIINTPEDAVVLPKTGGTGTGIMYSAGLILILVSGALLLRRQRRSI